LSISRSFSSLELWSNFRDLESLSYTKSSFAALEIGVCPHAECKLTVLEGADVVLVDTVDGVLVRVVESVVCSITLSFRFIFFLGSFPSKLVSNIRVSAKIFWEALCIFNDNIHVDLLSKEFFGILSVFNFFSNISRF
jgi:hypothetical protein